MNSSELEFEILFMGGLEVVVRINTLLHIIIHRVLNNLQLFLRLSVLIFIVEEGENILWFPLA